MERRLGAVNDAAATARPAQALDKKSDAGKTVYTGSGPEAGCQDQAIAGLRGVDRRIVRHWWVTAQLWLSSEMASLSDS